MPASISCCVAAAGRGLQALELACYRQHGGRPALVQANVVEADMATGNLVRHPQAAAGQAVRGCLRARGAIGHGHPARSPASPALAHAGSQGSACPVRTTAASTRGVCMSKIVPMKVQTRIRGVCGLHDRGNCSDGGSVAKRINVLPVKTL